MTTIESKFADLPWIAVDQPDCYEFGSSQPVSKNNEITKDLNFSIKPEIESESFPVTQAFNAFKNAYLDSAGVDFSDITSSKTNKGYRAVLYDLVAENEKRSESLSQRFDRIQLELNQLIQDAQTVSDEKGDEKSPEKIKDLKEKAEQFKSYLDTSFKSLNIENVSVKPRNFLTDSIAKNFEDLKKTHESIQGDDGEIILSLLHSVKNEKTYEKERIVELEKKISRLEALVGNEDLSKFSSLTCGNANASLYEIAHRLEAKASLIDPKTLTQIESRLTSFNQILQSIPEKREKIAEADTIKKIGELYETVKKWSTTYESIPMIVDHLVSLKDIHSKAANFSESLTLLESKQDDTQKKIGDLIDFFQSIHPQFEKQTKVINERMEALSKSLEK